MNEQILVAVRLLTYNQEAYIRQCLEGIISQKVNFSYKIIIGDDCSTDKTSVICSEFKEKHTNKIIYNFNNPNNIAKNSRTNFKLCFETNAKYIALIEGDDYWTDPLKLQKQVDFLEANPDYNICFHEVSIFNQSNNSLEKNTKTREVKETTDINDLAKGNYIHTPSVVMRTNFTIPKWISKAKMGDWSLYMIVTKDKKIKKLDDVMAVYRVHDASIWALKPNEYRILNTISSFKLYLKFNPNIGIETKDILNESIENLENLLPKKETIVNKVLIKIKRYLQFK